MTTVNNNTNTGATTTGTTTAQQKLSSNYQDFLKLLTVQLQNQDPTAPTDTNQLTQQIASLSQVEQQIATNDNLNKLISLFSAVQLNNAVNYIGKQIDATGNQGILSGGGAGFVYNLPSGTSSAKLTIMDSSGKTVFNGDGTTIAGRNEVFWDGTNSLTGAKMPDGTYTFKVDAKDASGNTLTATTYTTGIVTSVDTQDGNAMIMLGNLAIPLSSVQSIRNLPDTSTANNSTDTGSSSGSSSNSGTTNAS